MTTELEQAIDWCLDHFDEWYAVEFDSFEEDYYWRAAFPEGGAGDEYIRMLQREPDWTLQMYRSDEWEPPAKV